MYSVYEAILKSNDHVSKRNEVSEHEVQRYQMFCEYMDKDQIARAEFVMQLIFMRLMNEDVPEPFDIQVLRHKSKNDGIVTDYLILDCCHQHGCGWSQYHRIDDLRQAYRPFDILTYLAAKWTRHYRECDFAQLALDPKAVGEWDIVTGLRV